MTAYFDYLKHMIIEFFTNFGLFFYDVFAGPWKRVPAEIDYYNSLYANYSPDFGAGGWFFFVLFLLLLLAALAAFGYLIYYLITKYVHFRAKTEDVGKYRSEIERLNLELYHAISEKDRVLGLQVASLSGIATVSDSGSAKTEKKEEEGEKDERRFPKLANVDAEYLTPMPATRLPDDAEGIGLKGICERFRLFCASQLGLYYTIDTMREFIASIGTSKIIILEGISGTGKTSLPYAFGRFLKHNATICSVQPSWHDRSELLGYYNDFTHRFTETEFLRAVYEATYRDDLSVIVLDEMNLARIEYYFAEFLSIMEMPNVSEWNISLVAAPREDDPRHLNEGRLLIPQNIVFVGTANNDDSTFTITDKVYDRSMSLFFDNKGIAFESEFTEACPLPYDYLSSLFAKAKVDYPLSAKTRERFEQLDSFVIAKFKLAFGNRILRQLESFVPCYCACGGTELEAVDYMFESKILKKFEVLNVSFLRDELLELDTELSKLFGKGEFKRSKAKIRGFLKQVS